MRKGSKFGHADGSKFGHADGQVCRSTGDALDVATTTIKDNSYNRSVALGRLQHRLLSPQISLSVPELVQPGSRGLHACDTSQLSLISRTTHRPEWGSNYNDEDVNAFDLRCVVRRQSDLQRDSVGHARFERDILRSNRLRSGEWGSRRESELASNVRPALLARRESRSHWCLPESENLDN